MTQGGPGGGVAQLTPVIAVRAADATGHPGCPGARP